MKRCWLKTLALLTGKKKWKELEDSIEVINNEIRGKQLEVTTVEQSDEYKAAKEEAEKAWANLQLL